MLKCAFLVRSTVLMTLFVSGILTTATQRRRETHAGSVVNQFQPKPGAQYFQLRICLYLVASRNHRRYSCRDLKRKMWNTPMSGRPL